MQNNNHDLRLRLEELVEFNRTMLKYAEEGKWEKVIEAEIVRKNMFESFYKSPGVEHLPDVASATREILDINKSLEKLAASARQAVTTEAASAYKGQRAISAYSKNTR